MVAGRAAEKAKAKVASSLMAMDTGTLLEIHKNGTLASLQRRSLSGRHQQRRKLDQRNILPECCSCICPVRKSAKAMAALVVEKEAEMAVEEAKTSRVAEMDTGNRLGIHKNGNLASLQHCSQSG
eukprot:6039423-Pleurochrysis_carterae.AAC.1